MLRDEDRKILFGDMEAVQAPITFSLSKVEKGIAVYQLDMSLAQGSDVRKVRQRFAIEVATGRLIEIQNLDEELGPKSMVKSELRVHFAW